MLEDTLRSAFIEQMIAELNLQKNNDETSFNIPPISSSKKIFRSLCFDYPVITSEELMILSQDISKDVTDVKSSSSLNQQDNQQKDVYNYWLNEKFIDNLIYLSGSSLHSDKDREKSIGTLCAAVFLKLPLRLLNMTRGELSLFFDGPGISNVSYYCCYS